MLTLFRFPVLSGALLGAGLLLNSPVARAQGATTSVQAAHGYDFLTVTTIESISKNYAKLLFSPAFEGKSEIPLEDYSGLGLEKYFDKIQRNTLLINQQLSNLTVAGWELVEVHVAPFMPANPSTTRYLFRKAKN
ncbi:MAG: hypothetical protein EOO62_06010 [Hymenobacter sp.]|nr:MAG: hypothetical protein EOO62_06010 [Hymenobacter sp.]